MASLFKNRTVVDHQQTQMLHQALEWFLSEPRLRALINQSNLITPADSLYTMKTSTPEQTIIHVVQNIRQRLRMDAWTCHLILEPHQHRETDSSLRSSTNIHVLEAASPASDQALLCRLTLDMALCNKPLTMMHEIIVALVKPYFQWLQEHLRPNPIDVPNHAYYRDLFIVLMGFGLIYTNANFQLNELKVDSVQRNQSMDVNELVYGLAVYCVLKNIEHHRIEMYLKLPLHALFKQALVEIGQTRTQWPETL